MLQLPRSTRRGSSRQVLPRCRKRMGNEILNGAAANVLPRFEARAFGQARSVRAASELADLEAPGIEFRNDLGTAEYDRRRGRSPVTKKNTLSSPPEAGDF